MVLYTKVEDDIKACKDQKEVVDFVYQLLKDHEEEGKPPAASYEREIQELQHDNSLLESSVEDLEYELETLKHENKSSANYLAALNDIADSLKNKLKDKELNQIEYAFLEKFRTDLYSILEKHFIDLDKIQ